MLLFCLILGSTLACCYCLLMMGILYGWLRLTSVTEQNMESAPLVSVIIPYRNEAAHLQRLLSALNKQSYPKSQYEIILVDDHSTDNSMEIIKQNTPDKLSLILVQNPDNKLGKKSALSTGLDLAQGTIILLSDADCLVGPDWISCMIRPFQNPNCLLVQGPVLIQSNPSVLSKLQQLEFLSLMMSAAGSIGLHQGILASGANLAVRKDFYDQAVNQLKNQINTGDDMFLLEQAKRKHRQAIQFVKSRKAMVQTAAVLQASQLWNQRKRWSSKAVHYSDWAINFSAGLVLLSNAFILFSLILALMNAISFTVLVGFWLIKSLLELPIIVLGSKFYQISKTWFWFWPTQLVYPFYITLIALSGVLGSFSWKDRQKVL